MGKFLILFNAPEPMSEFMVRSTPEERQAGLEAWDMWREEAEKLVRFEFGAVVQAFQRIEQTGVANSPNQTSNYAFAEAASKDDLGNALHNHPHLQRKGASIDVLEVLSMPRQ
jgi:hypothetical protein